MKNNDIQPTTWTSRIINPQGQMPIGVSSFQELTSENYTYVDKSLFIKEILDSGNKVVLITRPRRFGKTLNMSMLHEFLAEKNPQNDPFGHLAIAQAGTKYQKERGKRPVIYLSFKDIKGLTWQDVFPKIRRVLARVVDPFIQLVESSNLSLPDQRILKEVYNEKANPEACEDLLFSLTKLLTLHYGQAPWVLIDEYDTPMQTAYQHGFYEKMRNLIRNLLSTALKDNIDRQTRKSFLHKSVVTGIVRIAKEDIFSGLNNLGTYGVSEEEFSNHFGFTQEELDALLKHKGLMRHQETVRQWYNGYQFGEYTIYNPWSIINFIDSKKHAPKLYWINTSNNHLAHELLAKADGNTKKGLTQLLNQPAYQTSTQRISSFVPLGEINQDAQNIWGLLLASGYITSVKHSKIAGSSDLMAALRIPNEEVRSVYGDLLHHWLKGVGNTSGYNLLDYLTSGDLENFATDFSTFFHESASYFDIGTNAPEKFYHGFILGMVQHLRDDYNVLSQKESGGGRYDLALEPKDKNQPGFLFEFKRWAGLKGSVAEIQAKLQAPAKEALDQIKSKEYARQIFAAGVQVVHALGLAFSGKEVCVVFESLNDIPTSSHAG